MTSEVNWIFPKLKYPSRFWKLCSYTIIGAVGFFSKIIIGKEFNVCFNKTKAFNKHILDNAIENRTPGTPLLTVSNHESCFDDPGMWGLLKLRQVCNSNFMRWSLAAHDICFTNKFHSWFFMLGKCIPVIRGAGVYQTAVDLCIDKLSIGDWVHVFPEGKVNMTKEKLRLKWGVGRMVYESPVSPIVIPIWHIGMDEILPNEPPYYLRFGKRVTYNFGKPIDLSQIIKKLRESNVSDVEARRVITDRIQDAMYVLKAETEELHRKS